jgi:hypothetical protein
VKDYGQSGVGPDVQIGRQGARYKSVGGIVQIRNAGDTAYARTQGADSVVDDDYVTRRQLLAAGGALAGLPGAIYESLQFYMDPSDRNSYVGSGPTVNDLMGNATGGVLATATLEDGAFEFDGSAGAPGSVNFPTKASSLNNVFAGGGGTVIAFLRAADDGQGSLGVVAGTANDADQGWLMHTTGKSSGHIGVRFTRNFDSGTGGQWTSNTQVNPINGQSDRVLHAGAWSSWAVAYDDALTTNVPTFYVNGTNAPLTTTVSPLGNAVSDAGNPLRFGSTINVSNPWTLDGQLGPVLIFDRILSADEIAAVHNALAQRFGLGWRGMDGKLIGSGPTDMSGQDVTVRAGDSYSTLNSEAEGGSLSLVAGDHLGGGNAAAGRVYIASGSGGGNIGDSGEVLIESGANSLGAAVTIRVGDQNTGNTPGTMRVRGGDNYGAGFAGSVEIVSGGAIATSRIAGTLTCRAADGNEIGGTNVTGGQAIFRAGDGINRAGGNWTGRAGDGGPGQGGDWTARAGNSPSGNSRGGRVSLLAGNAAGAFEAGDCTVGAGSVTGAGAGRGGNLVLFAGSSADGDGGFVTIDGGDTSSNDNGDPAGGVTITGGSALVGGADTGSGGGTVALIGGNSPKTSTASPAGGATMLGGSGTADSANSRGGPASVTGGPVTGNTAGAIAGDATITGGAATSPTAANQAGYVRLRGGTDSAGTNHGGITAVTDAPTAPFQVRTQAGFAGTDEDHLTVGANVALGPGASVDLLVLATLATNGHNVKLSVEVTGVDSASIGDQSQQLWKQSYHRNGLGTIGAFVADLNPGKHLSTPVGFCIDVNYSLVVVGNEIRLRATNGSSTVTDTGYFAARCVRQEGGFSS